MNSLSLKDLINYNDTSNWAAIVANGQFPFDSDLLIKLIKSAPLIICCDGAISNLEKHDITPQYIVGDCDSITPNLKHKYFDKVIKISDQNTNDLTKAINFAKSKNVEKIIIFGATGLREDHALANISLLHHYIKTIPEIMMISEFGIFSVHLEHHFSLPCCVGQQISIFCKNSNTGVSCSELKWPLDNFHTQFLYQGTLNEATKNILNFTIDGGSVIIYRSLVQK